MPELPQFQSSSPGNITRDKPLRVLHVLEATLGGTLRYLENIAEATDGLPLQTGLAYGFSRADSRLAPLLERVHSAGWRTYPVDMRREVDVVNDLQALWSLRRVIREFQPDIVHCHSSKAGALGRAALMVRLRPIARLYSPHALASHLGRKYLLIERFLARFTDRFVAVSESERQEIVSLSLAKAHSTTVVYPVVDSGYFTPLPKDEARRRLGLAPGPLIVSVGRSTFQKNPQSFIEVVRRVRARVPDVQALWIGAGVGEIDFPALVRESGMEETIRPLPWQHDVRGHIAAADLVLSCSRTESFGYITAEALSMGVPVVASAVTGTRDIMRGQLKQFLFAEGQYDEAARIAVELIQSPEQHFRAAQMGRDQVVQLFSCQTMREALMQLYSSAIFPLACNVPE